MAIVKKVYNSWGNWMYVDEKVTDRMKIDSCIENYKEKREKEMMEARRSYIDKHPYLPR